MNPLLRESNPELAEVVEQMANRYERPFDFSSDEHQAIFAEGLHEMGRHIALSSSSADVKIDVSKDGISGLRISITPRG